MEPLHRPLWKILALAARQDAPLDLTCDEVFTIMEYLADLRLIGAISERLWRAVLAHLACCPGCRERHLSQLRVLEAVLVAQGRNCTFRKDVPYE